MPCAGDWAGRVLVSTDAGAGLRRPALDGFGRGLLMKGWRCVWRRATAAGSAEVGCCRVGLRGCRVQVWWVRGRAKGAAGSSKTGSRKLCCQRPKGCGNGWPKDRVFWRPASHSATRHNRRVQPRPSRPVSARAWVHGGARGRQVNAVVRAGPPSSAAGALGPATWARARRPVSRCTPGLQSSGWLPAGQTFVLQPHHPGSVPRLLETGVDLYFAHAHTGTV